MRNIFRKVEYFGASVLFAAGLAGVPALAHGRSSTTSNTPSNSTVQQAQQELKDEGYYHGQIDGDMGRQTRQALREYQKVNNLSMTGRLDQNTISSLGVTQSNTTGEASRSADPNQK